MYMLSKFQLHILKRLKWQPYKVAETERSIYSKHREITGAY